MVTPGAAQVPRQIDLKEYEKSDPLTLTRAELGALRSAISPLGVDPSTDEENAYTLTPGSTVGAVEIDGLSVRIEPKIGIGQLLSLACYAIDKVKFQPNEFDFPERLTLPDVLALALECAARRAFARGLLHGYREQEEALYTVRGRIRFDDQLRRRFGVPLPVEVRYDEFTDDIPANRIIKAAAHKLRGMRLRSNEARAGLGWVAAMLDNVSLVEFTPKDVPTITFDRLNAHYDRVVALAQVVLRRNAFEAARGDIRASGFLMDMNKVFQDFVTVALRDALGLTDRQFGEDYIDTLDAGDQIRLRPDLVWRDGARYVFVGDAKYKRIEHQSVPNADLYQLLAYTTALNLPGGLLIYAQDDGVEPASYTVRHSGKRLQVAALDLSGDLPAVLDRVGNIAKDVRRLAGRETSLRIAS